MEKKIIAVGFLLVVSFLLTPSYIVSAVSYEATYVKIHCDVNISFIENNLCTGYGCSPIVEKSGDDYFVDDILVIPDDELIYFFIAEYNNVTSSFKYIFSDSATEFLKQACNLNITSVLNYIKKNNFTEYYNDFYPYKIIGENVRQIDNVWYMKSSSPDFDRLKDWWELNEINFVLVILILIIGIAGSYFYYLKRKKK